MKCSKQFFIFNGHKNKIKIKKISDLFYRYYITAICDIIAHLNYIIKQIIVLIITFVN